MSERTTRQFITAPDGRRLEVPEASAVEREASAVEREASAVEREASAVERELQPSG